MTNQRELFVSFFFDNEHDLKNYIQMLVRDWNVTEEIVQEVVIVLWEKYHEITDGKSFRKLLFTIAKYKILAYRRQMAHNRLFFDETAIALLTDASIERKNQSSREREILSEVLTTLNQEDQDLLFNAYESDVKIKELAQKQGKTPTSLYKKLQKIRSHLLKKVQQIMDSELFLFFLFGICFILTGSP